MARKEIPDGADHDRLPVAANSPALTPYDSRHGGFYPEGEEEIGGIRLREYWRVVSQHKVTILVFVFIVLLGTLVSTALQTPIFRSSVKIQIDREAAQVVDFQGVMPKESAYSYDFYQTQYELLRSRALARRVIERLGLESYSAFVGEESPSFFQQIRQWLSNLLQGKAVTPVEPDEETPEQPPRLESLLLANLTVSPIEDSRLVVIHYDSPDPQLAARVVNALAQSFIDMNLERRFENTAYAKTFLSERIKQVRADLERSERRLVEYAGQRGIVDMEHKQGILMQKLQAVSQRMSEVEGRRIAAESTYKEMQATGIEAFSEVTENELIQTYKEKLADLEAKYAEDLNVYKPAYPKMRKLQDQIENLKAKIAHETRNIHDQLQAQFKAAVREQAMLESRMVDIKQQILDLQRRSTDYQALKRDVETNRELYDGLLQRIKEVGVAAGAGVNNVSIIDAGEVPAAAFKPNLRRNLQIALILGLVGGVGLAFLFEFLDDTVKSTSDVEQLTGLPVLGMIPEVRQADEEESIALLSFENPKSPLAEAYRSCRTALTFATDHGVPEVLQVTSSGAGEGKTTTAINLALGFVQAGKNVLIVDADLRSPSLHSEFDLANDNGLTNYLVGDLRPRDVVQKSGLEGLYLLPSGPLPPNPAELLGSRHMDELLSSALDRFDVVLVDGPPVLGLADALVLANQCTATLLVVDAGVTRKDALRSALHRLRQARANVVGALLLKVGQGRSGYGYDYNYHYNYYGASDEADGGRLVVS